MPNQPSQEIVQELNEAKTLLQTLQNEWQETLADLTDTKNETKTKEIFAVIDYLTYCDQLCNAINADLKAFDSKIRHLAQIRKKLHQDKCHLEFIDELLNEMQEFRSAKYNKMMNIDEEYSILSEHTLGVAQNLITLFSDRMLTEKVTPTINNELKQGLEKELFLEELRDSLESYREAREDFVSALIMESLQNLPEDQIPEDLGEEEPEIDFVLSQLNTAITACDTAILEKKIQE